MKAAILALVAMVAAETPAWGQEIRVSVRTKEGRPVYSTVYFRPSSSVSWNRLGVTEANGTLKAALACAPGMEVYADPFEGEYWNSLETACRSALPLEVKPREEYVLRELLTLAERSPTATTRIDFAHVVGRAEAREFRKMSGETALDAYLVSSSALPAGTAEKIEMNLLNESSGFYARVDDDRNGSLSRAEIRSALAETRFEASSPN